jgi:hypothetical protein
MLVAVVIEDAEENGTALAKAYKDGWRNGIMQQRVAELAALNEPDRQAALEAKLSLDISGLLVDVNLVVG